MGSERVYNRDWRPNLLNVRIDQVQNLAKLDALQLILSLFSKSFCDLWFPPKHFDHAQNTHRCGTAMLVYAIPVRKRHLTFRSNLDARICLFRGQPLMPETSTWQIYPFHALFLNLLDSICKKARKRKENEHRCEPDKCTPAKDGV
jgi:hypothetical protein